MSKLGLSTIAIAFALTACESPHEPDPVQGPQLQSSQQASGQAASQRVVARANGDGLVNFGSPGAVIPGADIELELNALLQADGGARGSTSYFADLTAFGLGIIDVEFDVTCVTIDTDLGRAWIGGVVTANNSTNETFDEDPVRQPGRDVWFRIEDNGNGGSGTLDLSTQLGFEGGLTDTSEEFCNQRPWPAPPPHPLVSGNFSVQ